MHYIRKIWRPLSLIGLLFVMGFEGTVHGESEDFVSFENIAIEATNGVVGASYCFLYNQKNLGPCLLTVLGYDGYLLVKRCIEESKMDVELRQLIIQLDRMAYMTFFAGREIRTNLLLALEQITHFGITVYQEKKLTNRDWKELMSSMVLTAYDSIQYYLRGTGRFLADPLVPGVFDVAIAYAQKQFENQTQN